MSQQSKPQLPGKTGSSTGSSRSTTGDQRHDCRRVLIICFCLAVTVFAVFGQTRRFAFVNYDDDVYIYENPAITGGLNFHDIGWAFTHTNGRGEWFPVTSISHMLDWQLYGPHAGGHHLTNFLLQAINAILLFLLLRKLSGKIWPGAFAAALFAIHPLRAESVAWVTERKDMLSGLFFMLTLWMWVRYAQKRMVIEGAVLNAQPPAPSSNPQHWLLDYCLALIFFVLGLMSKSMLVMLPFVLLLLDYWPLNRLEFSTPRVGWSRLILEKIPFVFLSAASCTLTILTQTRLVSQLQGLTLPWRIGNALLAYVVYLGHTIYPVGLMLLYPHAELQLPAWKPALAALALFLISAIALVNWRKRPYLLVGWLWYLAMLVPVIDFMQAGDQTRADRYTYLPQIGLFILIAWTVGELSRSWRYRHAVLGSLAGAALAALMVRTYIQTAYWKDSLTLWTHTLSRNPQSLVAHCNLGIALAGQGNLDEAIENFNQALKINPDDTKSLNDLGKALMAQKKFTEATQCFDHVLQIDSNNADAVNNSGAALAAQNNLPEAVQHYQRALQLNPDFADAYYNLGNALITMGQVDEAATNYERAVQLKPNFAQAHCNLGLVLTRQGKLDEAVRHFQKALEIDPNNTQAHNNLGSLLAVEQKLDQAVQNNEQALRQNPNDPAALNNLGVIRIRQGKFDEAIEHLNRALQLDRNDASAQNNLGIALAKEGKLNEAIPHFQRALDLATDQNNTALAEAIRKRLASYSQSSSPQAP